MIYAAIKDVEKYKAISKWFSYAADFLEKTDLHSLPYGRTDICGEHLFINVMEADTKEADETSFEIHKKYWDVQIDIEGTEVIQVATGAAITKEPFREDIDFGTVSCEDFISCVMGPDRFIICMQEEPHKPTLTYGDCKHVKKCVIKVEVE